MRVFWPLLATATNHEKQSECPVLLHGSVVKDSDDIVISYIGAEGGDLRGSHQIGVWHLSTKGTKGSRLCSTSSSTWVHAEGQLSIVSQHGVYRAPRAVHVHGHDVVAVQVRSMPLSCSKTLCSSMQTGTLCSRLWHAASPTCRMHCHM